MKKFTDGLGGIGYVWVELPTRPAIAVARADEQLTDDELEQRAKRWWAQRDREEAAAQELQRRFPKATVVIEMDGRVAAYSRRGRLLDVIKP